MPKRTEQSSVSEAELENFLKDAAFRDFAARSLEDLRKGDVVAIDMDTGQEVSLPDSDVEVAEQITAANQAQHRD